MSNMICRSSCTFKLIKFHEIAASLLALDLCDCHWGKLLGSPAKSHRFQFIRTTTTIILILPHLFEWHKYLGRQISHIIDVFQCRIVEVVGKKGGSYISITGACCWHFISDLFLCRLVRLLNLEQHTNRNHKLQLFSRAISQY